MRNFTSYAALALLGASIGLAASEIVLRVAGVRYSGSIFTADPRLGWALRPGAGAWEADEGLAWIRINRHGFRDRDRDVKKPEGVYRIAVLGDSLTEAGQVDMDKTFTALAEKALNQRHCYDHRQVEVLNFGIPGFGTGQELILLRERIWAFEPDAIVLQVYSGNDIFNNHRALNPSDANRAPYFTLREGELELDDSFRSGRAFNPTYIAAKGILADITNSSVLLQMLYKLIRLRAQHQQTEDVYRSGAAAPDAPPPEYQRYLAYLPPTLPAMTEAWQVTEALLVEFDREAATHHVPWLLMIVPTSHQIHPDAQVQAAYRATYHIDSLEYADDRIEQVARTRGIRALRLTQPLLDEARRTGAFMVGFANTDPNEGHPNERGHQVIARELVERLCGMQTAADMPADHTQSSEDEAREP
jgi:hypothetical protein